MKFALPLAIMLTGCVSDPPLPAPLFDCKGKEERYILRALDDGALALEIQAPPKGNIGTSTHLVNWTEIRTGFVTGQQGGHQGHVRLSDGPRHFVLYEGRNGQLSNSPGKSYAGVALVTGNTDSEPQTLAECPASPINQTLLDNVQKERTAANAPPLVDEDSGGAFDGWF